MKLSEGKLKYSWKSVKGNKSKEKENMRLFEHKAYLSAGIPLTYHSVLSFFKNVIRFLNTVTYWLMWLIVTCVRQFGSDGLKVRYSIWTCADVQPLCTSRLGSCARFLLHFVSYVISESRATKNKHNFGKSLTRLGHFASDCEKCSLLQLL